MIHQTLLLAQRLGDISTPSFQRLYFHNQLHSLEHNTSYTFNYHSRSYTTHNEDLSPPLAHASGTNCLTIDPQQGRYLISGGADTAIRLWDLNQDRTFNHDEATDPFHPLASLTKADQSSHSHSLTSLSVFPHDPVPSTIFSTSYDTTLLLTALTPTSLQAVHKFSLDHPVYTHALSPVPSAQPLVAAGTAHPAIRLLDLRSGLATHSLPGHQGAVWSLTWHPRVEWILLSAGVDGRILCFDIRRASPAFASLDVEDTIGIVDTNPCDTSSSSFLPRPHLDYTHRAHAAPITGITFTPSTDKLLSCSHDQRLRLWDIATGRNELVHFGARIRNERNGEFKPLLAPTSMAGGEGSKRGAEVVVWANDDGKGEISLYSLREGEHLSTIRMRGLKNDELKAGRNAPVNRRGGGGRGAKLRAGMTAANKLTARGRVNAMCLRPVTEDGEGAGGVELYTGHGDGGICVWTAGRTEGLDEEDEEDEEGGNGSEEEEESEGRKVLTQEEMSRKRKRELLGDLVEGLTKRPITFS